MYATISLGIRHCIRLKFLQELISGISPNIAVEIPPRIPSTISPRVLLENPSRILLATYPRISTLMAPRFPSEILQGLLSSSFSDLLQNKKTTKTHSGIPSIILSEIYTRIPSDYYTKNTSVTSTKVRGIILAVPSVIAYLIL